MFRIISDSLDELIENLTSDSDFSALKTPESNKLLLHLNTLQKDIQFWRKNNRWFSFSKTSSDQKAIGFIHFSLKNLIKAYNCEEMKRKTRIQSYFCTNLEWKKNPFLCFSFLFFAFLFENASASQTCFHTCT